MYRGREHSASKAALFKMIYILTLVIGLALGSSLVWVYARRYWIKRLYNAQQAISAQYSNDIQQEARKTQTAIERRFELEEKIRLLQDEHEDLTTHVATLSNHLEAAQQALKTAEQTYEERLALEKKKASQSSREMQERYEGDLIEKQCECTSLKMELDKCEQNKETNLGIFFKEHEALEQTNRILAADKQRLESELLTLQAELIEQKQLYNHDRCLAAQKLEIDFGHIIDELFPNVDLLRDSLDEINRNKNDFSTLLFRIRALSSGDVSHSRKVRATHNVWSECRAPNMGMMRIYYRKTKEDLDRYELLVSRKKNSKSQKQDIDWLKTQPN